ncbi:mucin-2-like isoform X2 [Saccostrea cucullata]|uniref:mucin-2-like isoform X2 n=1 Tax=Saccostrea cuccullata TaxID=36930 RepID=UPI002ED40B87
MAMSPFGILLLTSLLNEWKLSKGVEILTCPSSSSIQIGSTTTTFQFGDGRTPYNTVLSCTWTFTASDSSASLVIGQNLKCGDGDSLGITNVKPGDTFKSIDCCSDCTKPAVITGNTARISFTSDSTQKAEDIGFSLEIFAGIEKSDCTKDNNTFNIQISSPYVITSPNFPGYYPANMDCNYTFTPVPPSLGLVISFQFINLDYDRGCYDQIILKEGDMNGSEITKICQGYPVNSPVISPNLTYRTSGALFLEFKSDNDYQARGFRAIVSQDSTSGNTETTPTVVTESTTTASTIQSTTVSTTTERTTQSTTLVSATATTTASVLTTSQRATAENTSPTPSETETTSTTRALESTTTKTTPASSPTSQETIENTTLTQQASSTTLDSTDLTQELSSTTIETTTSMQKAPSTTQASTSSTQHLSTVETIEGTTLTQQASPTTLDSTVLTQELSSTTIETTTSMQKAPSTTQASTSSTQHLSTVETIEGTTLTQQASPTTLDSTVLTQELSSTTIETTTLTQQPPSTTQDSTSSTQHLSTVDSPTTSETTTSTQQISLSTTEDITSSQPHASTLVKESTTTPRQSTTTVVTFTDLSYLDRLGFTPTTFAAMTTGVSFLILVTIGIFVLLLYTIHRKNKFKNEPQKKYQWDDTCKKNNRRNVYSLRTYPTAFQNRKPLFYYYW